MSGGVNLLSYSQCVLHLVQVTKQLIFECFFKGHLMLVLKVVNIVPFQKTIKKIFFCH